MCVDDVGFEASLWIGKVYQVIRPHINDGPKGVRVIDEEGEDYLYAASKFVAVALPKAAKRAVLTASKG